MPLFKGPLSGAIYETEPFERDAEQQQAFVQSCMQAIKNNAFIPIDKERGRELSSGWVNVRRILDTKLDLDKVFFKHMAGAVVALSFRIDKVLIDKRRFEAEVNDREAKALKESKHPKLSKYAKENIKEQVRLEMIVKAEPRTAIIELGWDLSSGKIYFGNNGAKAGELFSALFKTTFGRAVRRVHPVALAIQYADENELVQAFGALEPSNMSASIDQTVRSVMADQEPAAAGNESGQRQATCDPGGFLGKEFISWAWFMAQQNRKAGEIAIGITGPMTLVGQFGDARAVVLTGKTPEASPEAMLALDEGKRLSKCKLCLSSGHITHKLNIAADNFALNGLALPKIKDHDASSIMILRMAEFSAFARNLVDAFSKFLELRLDNKKWNCELVIIREWVGGANGD